MVLTVARRRATVAVPAVSSVWAVFVTPHSKSEQDSKNEENFFLILGSPLASYLVSLSGMEEDDPRFSHVDLGSLLEDLSNYAKGLFTQRKCTGDEAMLPGTGTSPEDLACEALTVFVIKMRDWRPSSPDTAQTELYFLVRKILEHDFIDLVRGRAFKDTEILRAGDGQAGLDGDLPYEHVSESVALPDLAEVLNDEEIIRRAYAAVEGKPDLEEYLDAVLRDHYTKRSKVAKHLALDLKEATRRRDRLKTRLLPLMRALGLVQASKSHKA